MVEEVAESEKSQKRGPTGTGQCAALLSEQQEEGEEKGGAQGIPRGVSLLPLVCKVNLDEASLSPSTCGIDLCSF